MRTFFKHFAGVKPTIPESPVSKSDKQVDDLKKLVEVECDEYAIEAQRGL